MWGFSWFGRHQNSKTDKELRLALRSRLGFKPRNIELYKVALTHGSVLNRSIINHYERLEFLGDAVIEMIVSEYLYNHFPQAREGFLTQVRSNIVRRQRLAQFAERLNLQPLLLTYRVKISTNVLGNTFEALMAAIYLDIGYKRTASYFTKHIIEPFVDIDDANVGQMDYKCQLYQRVQHYHWTLLFDTSNISNNIDSPRFHCRVRINGSACGEGTGHKKKEAQQNAAQKAIENWNEIVHMQTHVHKQEAAEDRDGDTTVNNIDINN